MCEGVKCVNHLVKQRQMSVFRQFVMQNWVGMEAIGGKVRRVSRQQIRETNP